MLTTMAKGFFKNVFGKIGLPGSSWEFTENVAATTCLAIELRCPGSRISLNFVWDDAGHFTTGFCCLYVTMCTDFAAVV
jgi:hypothetical protein